MSKSCVLVKWIAFFVLYIQYCTRRIDSVIGDALSFSKIAMIDDWWEEREVTVKKMTDEPMNRGPVNPLNLNPSKKTLIKPWNVLWRHSNLLRQLCTTSLHYDHRVVKRRLCFFCPSPWMEGSHRRALLLCCLLACSACYWRAYSFSGCCTNNNSLLLLFILHAFLSSCSNNAVGTHQ